jgi:ribonuclease VapC
MRELCGTSFFARPMLRSFSFTRDHYEVAVDAFERYGKGRHSAALNFGDCMTYAVARISGIPLLFAGRDFSKTDILRVRS